MMTQNNRFLRLTLFVFLLTASVSSLRAQDDYEVQSQNQTWYANRCEDAIHRFESMRQNAIKHPQKYCLIKNQQASPLDYALVISSFDETEMMLFTPDGNNLKTKRISKSIVPDSIYWEDISELGLRRTHSTDITLKQRPLPVRGFSKAKNTFDVVVETQEKVNDIDAYNQMIFKPHQNAVKLSNRNRNTKKDEDGTLIKDEMEYTFKLSNPAVMAKMFRGYDELEACPWVVKSSFFNHHHLLQYSRWKDGEPIRKASSDVCRLISDYYGGRRIVDSKWLATIESGERSFYAVQFAHEGTDALAAMVCIAEGDVVSTWEFHGKIDPDSYDSGQSIWFVDDEGNFMEHAPEIHCVVVYDEGLELYVRLYGGESVQYYILREMGPVWMELMVDYWIYVF